MNTTFEKLNTLTSVRDDVERMMSAYECDRDGCMVCRYRTTRPSGKRRISCCIMTQLRSCFFDVKDKIWTMYDSKQ